MTSRIDKNAYISPGFDIADDVSIGRNVCLEGRGQIGSGVVIGNGVVTDGAVRIGAGSRIGHYTVLSGEVEIGSGNVIHPFCSIGGGPEHPDMRDSSGSVVIGDDTVVREYTTITAPTVERATVIGSRCYIMASCHIAHDCVVGDDVKMANNATLAGHAIVGAFAYLALHSVVHQRLRIGTHCMIGMNATVTKHVPPCALIAGNRFRKINRRGLTLRGVTAAEVDRVEAWYRGIPADGDADWPLIAEIERFTAACGGDAVYPLVEG